jgi:uncharacterized protein YfdQ (DUF2303 family)
MTTETDSIAALARESAAGTAAVDTDRGRVFGVVLPPEWEHRLVDVEKYAPQPRRACGTVAVHTADAFAAAVKQRADDAVGPPIVYADEERTALVAILNDDHGAFAGWRDHRVVLSLRKRPEWTHWRNKDGQLMDQEAFANHVEDGLDELRDPSPTAMLDLAQTFHATGNARFKGGTRLANGVRQFTWEEQIDATAGTAGDVGIPETLTLAVRPFFGAELIEVTARFRFTLRSGELKLGYKLNRPDDVERFAFTKVVEGVEQLLDVHAIAGSAPNPRGE